MATAATVLNMGGVAEKQMIAVVDLIVGGVAGNAPTQNNFRRFPLNFQVASHSDSQLFYRVARRMGCELQVRLHVRGDRHFLPRFTAGAWESMAMR